MNNHLVDIRSEGRESFDHALAIFMGNQMGGRPTASHTSIIAPREIPEQKPYENEITIIDLKAPTFILFWTKPEDWKFDEIRALPYTMKRDRIGDIVWDWLQAVPQKQYGEFIEHDGSMGKGFRMWNENWGHVGGSWAGICAIRPIFAWYGK